jgi:predicted RNA binding protein YcfA (HicA-like mRNA interferase family)
MGQRLPSLSTDEVCSALVKAGFAIVPGRGKGSHVFLYRAIPSTGIIVPRAKDIKRGTLRAIIRQAGLSVDDFLALL